MGLALKTAHLEIKRYTPTLAELYAPAPTRPFFEATAGKDPCPYCGSPLKWHASIRVHRIESGKATDALRRELVKSLPKSGDQFVLLEQKATGPACVLRMDRQNQRRHRFRRSWLAARDFAPLLSRKEPKVDWQAHFDATHSIRRSRRTRNRLGSGSGPFVSLRRLSLMNCCWCSIWPAAPKKRAD